MPLRSNAAWFGDVDCRARLERQIKTYLVLYDYIVFEDGRYHITAGVDGQGMEMIWPRDSFPGDRTKIRFFDPGGEFGVTFGDKRLLTSTSQTAYDVDYLPIVRDAGLEHASCIRWSDEDIIPELKQAIRKRVCEDLLSEALRDVLPDNSYLRKQILEGLYRDALKAHFLESPFGVDFRARPVIELQKRMARDKWSTEIPVGFFDYWVNLDLPDFTELPWDDLYKFRETSVGISFRRMVHKISKQVKEILPSAADQCEVDQWLAQEFNKELLAELSRHISAPGGTLASICLNFVPYGFVPSIIKDAKTLYDDQTTWVSIVRGYKS